MPQGGPWDSRSLGSTWHPSGWCEGAVPVSFSGCCGAAEPTYADMAVVVKWSCFLYSSQLGVIYSRCENSQEAVNGSLQSHRYCYGAPSNGPKIAQRSNQDEIVCLRKLWLLTGGLASSSKDEGKATKWYDGMKARHSLSKPLPDLDSVQSLRS